MFISHLSVRNSTQGKNTISGAKLLKFSILLFEIQK